MESYKGIFIDEDTAAKSGKAIAYVPSEDGTYMKYAIIPSAHFEPKQKE